MGVLLILFGALLVGISTSRIGVGVSMIVFSLIAFWSVNAYYGYSTVKAVGKVIA